MAETGVSLDHLLQRAGPRPWKLETIITDGVAERQIVDNAGELVVGECWVNDENADLILFLVNNGLPTVRPKISEEAEVLLVESCVDVCFSLSPDHPEGVPALIPEMESILKMLVDEIEPEFTMTEAQSRALKLLPRLGVEVPYVSDRDGCARLDTKKEDGDG